MGMEGFWEERYREEGKIWGDAPSPTAIEAINVFRDAGVSRVLVLGSGYGRNAEAFFRAGFDVTGIELSETAVKIARGSAPSITYHCGSVLDMPFDGSRYEGIYCFNVLHLFRKTEREIFIQLCRNQLSSGGILFFVVFSEKEESFGRGRETEPGTFESKPGREVHYFTAGDLAGLFEGMEILNNNFAEEPEEHGAEGRHVHLLRFIVARKPSRI